MTPVSATQILHDDHKRIIGLFRQLEALDAGRSREMRAGVIRELFMEIEIHSAVEEQIFYPALLSAVRTPSQGLALDAGLIDQSVKDHKDVDEMTQRLRKIPKDTLDFQDQLEELEQLLEGHLEQEEQVLFKAAETLLKDDLSPLGAQIQDMRDDLLRQPKYRDARAEVVQNPNGGEQMRISTGPNAA